MIVKRQQKKGGNCYNCNRRCRPREKPVIFNRPDCHQQFVSSLRVTENRKPIIRLTQHLPILCRNNLQIETNIKEVH
jgi:hypothetical protein